MPDTESDEDRLFEEATDLVIRLQNDPHNPISLEMLEQWSSQSPAHARAWQEAAEIHGMAGKVLTDRRTAKRRSKRGMTRRNLVIGAGLGLGTYATGKFVVPDLLISARADHKTRTAEIRTASLSDGSTATLGPGSALALSYSDTERRIDLLEGMCCFEITDSARPFIVTAGTMTATGGNAIFDMSSDAGFQNISVNRGQVAVRFSEASASSSLTMSAGHWLTAPDNFSSLERGTRESSQFASWRNGLIVSERETVSSVVAKIARWIPGRTLVLDRDLVARRVSGVFDTARPLSALDAVAHPFGGKVRQLTSYLTVISTY